MSYLIYEEFKTITSKDIEKREFDNLLLKSSAVLDSVTSHFYARVDIEKDNPWRVDKFKQALTAQIEYFHVLGATTFEEINNAPQNFQAGRTRVSNTSRFDASGDNKSKPLVAEDVYIFLEGTGLLYRGIGVV